MYMAHVLPTSELGIYGLFTASVNYTLYLVGLDYYTYTTRELVSQPTNTWAPLLRDQLLFYVLTYTLSFPILLLVFSSGLLPWNLAIWFFAMVAIEHFSQEIYRIMVIIQKPVLANILSFLRLGAWVYAVLVVFHYTSFTKSLEVIWWGWALGGFSSIVIGLFVLRASINWDQLRSIPINWQAMYRGSKSSIRFLIATLSLRAVFTLDRYVLQEYTSITEVGIYSFYMSIATSMQSFLDAGVIIFSYPKVVGAYQSGDYVNYIKFRNQMRISVLGWVMALSIGVSLIIQPLVKLIEKEAFLDHLSVFYWLVATIGLLGLSNLPHYELYAQRKDKAIILSACWALLSFLGSITFLAPRWGMEGVAISLFVSMAVLYFSKFLYTLGLNSKRLSF